jgi:Phosphoadenosine phosphosulfate reductase family
MDLYDASNIVVSVSGGRTSAYLAYKIKNDPKLKDKKILYIFADTGKELPETISFLQQVDKQFELGITAIRAVISQTPRVGTQYEVFNLHEVGQVHATQFEDMVKKYGLPNTSRPHCTRTLKIEPINRFAKTFFGTNDYVTAVGIRRDELKRVKNAGAFNKIYPLVTTYPATIETIDLFFSDKEKPQLHLNKWEGNCDMCWKKADIKLARIAKDRPHVVQWWRDMEVKYGGEAGYTFYRRNRTIDDVLHDTTNIDTAALTADFTPDLSNDAHVGSHCDCE